MERWQEYLQEESSYSNVGFISLDATRMPIRSESLDSVVDNGGFGNVEGSDVALKKACRVLKSGGTLFLNDAETEGMDGLPPAVRKKWYEGFPHMRVGWQALVKSAGLETVERRTYGRREVRSGESDLGKEAEKHNTKISFIGVPDLIKYKYLT